MWLAAYEKLKMYGFYIHAGIDGGANFIVYIVVVDSKAASQLFRGYSQAVQLFGRPQAVRSDMAFEAGMIGQDMLDHVGQGSFVVGPSTANQVTTCKSNWVQGAQPWSIFAVLPRLVICAAC
jgi:hypothetical protein